MKDYYKGEYSPNDWRNYELYHHGILGQRWGVRRFQNSDGSLTSAGRKRYGEKLTKEEKIAKRREAEEAKIKKMNEEDWSDSKKQVAKFLAMSALYTLQLNPIGMADSTAKAIQAGSAYIKTKKFTKERALGETDPKTGFKLKHSELTEKEDLARVNPSFHNFDSNTKSNCMLCTTTYDMRRRGYDVTAKTAGAGFYNDEVKTWYPKAKVEKIVGVDPKAKNPKRQGHGRKVNDGIEKFTKAALEQGEGARGNIMVTWFPYYGGHSMVYEVSGGQVRILDGQSNKIYNNPSKILKQTTGEFEYARLDNVDFDPEAIKRCCR